MAIDLYAGAGGTTAGLKRAGFSVTLAIEFDDDAVKTYRAAFNDVCLTGEPIENYDAARIIREAKLTDDELDVLAACPPCQGFSSIGTKNPADARNDHITNVGWIAE